MREIKYRGMSVNGEWYYGLLAHTENRRVCPDVGWFISNSEGSPFAYQVRPETVGQFTGLHDKNGKEIYDGDILTSPYEDEVFVVEFENGYFGERRHGKDREPCEFLCDGSFLRRRKREVIGNVYENQELLK